MNKDNPSMNILISSAGSRVSLLRAFAVELKKISPQGKVYASDLNSGLSAACQDSCYSISVPPLGDPDFLDTLLLECQRNNIKLIIPTIDTELEIYASNLSLFEKHGISVVVSDTHLIQTFCDKRKTHEFFREFKVDVPTLYSHVDYKLPLFLKPFNGSGGQDTHIILCEDELIDRFRSNEGYMFLQYLDQKEYTEFTCDLYYSKDGKLRCAVPRKRIQVRDGEVKKGVTVRNFIEEYLKEKLSFIPGARGCLCVQVFVHNTTNEIKGIEVNPRFGGGFPLSYRSGANYPGWMLSEYILGESIGDKFDTWESDLLMLRYDHEVWVHGYKD